MKKLNKFFAVLVALAMMATLCVSMAFASPADLDESQKEVAASNAYMTKYLKIDEGVTIPNATFKFTFTPKASTTVLESELGEEFSKEITTAQMAPSRSTEDDGALVKALPLFGEGGILTNYVFPHNGEYIFEVEETIANADDPAIGTFGENNQKYILHVYKTSDGTSVTVEDVQETEDPDTGDTTEEKTKKDAGIDDPSDPDKEPGNEDDKTQDEISQTDVEGFSFVNDYELKDEYKPAEDGAFKVSKTTTGAYGDTTQAFPITVEVIFPTEWNGDKALDIYVGATSKGALNNEGKVTVELKNGETAYFKNLPDGATVKVVEDLTGSDITNAEYYKQTSQSVTKGGAPVAQASVVDGENNAVAKDKADATTIVKTKLTAADVTYNVTNVEAEKVNSVAVTNENLYDPGATGILMNNLPYIVLALVAIGGMVAYVVIRRRQSDEA